MLRLGFAHILMGTAAVLAATEISLRAFAGLGHPVLSTRDVACGYLPAPSQNVQRFGAVNYINRFGMRSEELPEKKDPTSFRIMCLGDSVQYGTTFVDQSRIYTSLLSHRLSTAGQHVDVLNISAGGWAPGNELGYLTSRGTFQSDLVVFCVNPTDLNGGFNHGTMTLQDGEPETSPACALEELWLRYAMPTMSRIVSPAPRAVAVNEPSLESQVPEMLTQLEEAKATANRGGAAFALIYTPGRTGDAGFDSEDVHRAHEHLVTWAQSHSVPMVDLTQAFHGYPTKDVFHDEIHLKAKGQDLIAQAFQSQWNVLASAELFQTQRAILAAR